MSLRANRSSARFAVLFVCAAAATACGGGGGGGGTDEPAGAGPASVAALSLAECQAKPVGLANTYLNNTRARREWVAATFEGEQVIARREFDAAGVLLRARYYNDDTAAKTSTIVGFESFDALGAVTRRLKFSGNTLSTALTAGQSQTIDYTWQVLLPAGEGDGAESLTQRYDGNEAVTLTQGRLEACKTTVTITNSSGAPVSTETAFMAKGANLVKSYLRNTNPAATDLNQTYLTELDTTTASLTFVAPTAQTMPSLASCSALPAGLNLLWTAADSRQAGTARGTTANATILGTNTIALQRRHVTTNALTAITHFDPTIGYLQVLGTESTDGASGVIFSGVPDLRTTAIGSPISYAETHTPYPSGTADTYNDRFTFLGHEEVTTPLGTFDTCKIRVEYGLGGSTTYWLRPGGHYLRFESFSAAGARGTREQLAP